MISKTAFILKVSDQFEFKQISFPLLDLRVLLNFCNQLRKVDKHSDGSIKNGGQTKLEGGWKSF